MRRLTVALGLPEEDGEGRGVRELFRPGSRLSSLRLLLGFASLATFLCIVVLIETENSAVRVPPPRARCLRVRSPEAASTHAAWRSSPSGTASS